MATSKHYETIAGIMLQDQKLGDLLAWLMIELDLESPNWHRISNVCMEIQQIALKKAASL